MEQPLPQEYDLEERLLDFGARIIILARALNNDFVERHVGKQVLRSGTSPLSNHGEAQAAESTADFIHKMRIALKELRETERWIKLIKKSELVEEPAQLDSLLDENDQLIRIFVASVATAEKNRRKP